MTLAVKLPTPPSDNPLLDYIDRDRREANPTRWEAAAQKSPPAFPGPKFESEHDEIRLKGLKAAVHDLMKDGRKRTLGEIRSIIGKGSETGISAMLRSFRKIYGKKALVLTRRGEPKDGLWDYQLIIPKR